MKTIRLIELFGGYGSQNLALKYLLGKSCHYKLVEWASKSIQAYNDLHIQDYTDYSKNLTDEEVLNALLNLGVSYDYNKPMNLKQLKLKDYRKIYNNIKATNNLVDVSRVHAQDLEIVETDKYDYIMTYSFPCQDLSLAGECKGMDRDSGTRSGLLWQVERILMECKNQNCLPQILVMENVPQVHGVKNKANFTEWLNSLESLGYKNYWQDLNAKDYGIPQNRNRTFMVSVLNGGSYEFSKKIQLGLRLRDLLEDGVDEKYYLSQKMVNYISADNEKWSANNEKSLVNKSIASTLNTKEGNRRCDASNYIADGLSENTDIKQLVYGNKRLDETLERNEVKEKDFIDAYNKQVKSDISGTITTRVSASNCSFVADKITLLGGVGEKKSNNNTQWYLQDRVYSGEGIALAVTTSVNPNYQFALKRGYSVGVKPEDADSNNIDVIGNYSKSNFNQTSIVGKNGVAPTVTENHGQVTAVTIKNISEVGIRKLTPKECFRLQGLVDEDVDKIMVHQTDSSCYHLAGDSICVSVLIGIFGKLLGLTDNEIEEKIRTIYNYKE